MRAVPPLRDRRGLGVLEDVVAEADHQLLAAGEVPRHPDDLGDPARLDLHLVAEVEVEERLVGGAGLHAAVAEQVDEVARMLLPGDEQHLADADPLQQLQRVVDHRPAADREQVLVGDARQLLEPRRRAACADEAFHGRGDATAVGTDGRTRTSRANGAGSHQFQRPRIAIMLGTRMQRTIVASTKIATARPSPNSCRPTMFPARNPENAAHMMTAAAVMIRPVRSSPWTTAALVVGPLVPCLPHARDEEDLVVHREAEEHREEEDRDPALDLVELVEAEQALADPEAEEEHEHPVGRSDREQVQEDGLERQEQRPERPHQQEVGEDQHGADQRDEVGVGEVKEVDTLGRARRRRARGSSPGSRPTGMIVLRSRFTNACDCGKP